MKDKQKDLIREVFLRNGFTIKAGADDLANYVYAAAHELLHNANRLAAADEIERLQAEVHRLREWIKDTGRQLDICTHGVLGAVCDGCGCERAGGKP